MSYRQLLEGSASLIIDYLKTNIGSALDTVGSSVGVPQVTLENPKEYFIYPKPTGYELPAIFVICDDMDFRIKDMKSNFINAVGHFKISALVEDQTEDLLTYKAWRYLSALHDVLNQTDILSSDESLKLTSVVYKTRISPTFMRQETSGDGGKFRKEILLECDVEHLENF